MYSLHGICVKVTGRHHNYMFAPCFGKSDKNKTHPMMAILKLRIDFLSMTHRKPATIVYFVSDAFSGNALFGKDLLYMALHT